MTQDFTDFIADAAWLTRTGHADAAEDMIFEAWSVHAAHPGFESSTPGPREARTETLEDHAATPQLLSRGVPMHAFLTRNRQDLIERCKAKVAQRPRRAATAEQLANGVPMFLEQLAKTLEAEEQGNLDESHRLSGGPGGDAALSRIGVSATAHGGKLLELGFTVDQVVHDYGDLCQAITDLAVERDAPFSVDHFRTLNRCLDNAIADAVKEFSAMSPRRAAGLRTRTSGWVFSCTSFATTFMPPRWRSVPSSLAGFRLPGPQAACSGEV